MDLDLYIAIIESPKPKQEELQQLPLYIQEPIYQDLPKQKKDEERAIVIDIL